MNSRNALFAILGGVALTTLIGILLIPYRDSSRRKKIADKAKDFTDKAEETVEESADNVKTQLKKMKEDTDRMVNEEEIRYKL